jgi:hypothetical protein
MAGVGFAACALIGMYLFFAIRNAAPSLHNDPRWAEDRAKLKNIVEALALHYTALPCVATGQLDPYRLWRDGVISDEDALDLFFSERLQRGPTISEISTGDYSRFPYERALVVSSTLDALLWDRRLDGAAGSALVAFRSGEVACVNAEEWATITKTE